ncbi:MAG: efflux RND transporter periplasmic adaptor subunit [Succinivibrionaceae bacterium]
MKKIIIIVLFVVAISTFAIYKFFESKPLSFMTTKATRGDITSTVLASGTLVGRNEVSVGAQVNGQLQKLYVELGDRVKKGDLIAEIDPRTQENNLASAKAELKIAQANKKQKQSLLLQQKAEYERQKNMRKKNATSDADLELALANLQQTEAAIEVCTAEIEKAKINVSTAETNLGYTKIVAPRDGVVISIVTEEGQTVVSSQSAPTIVKISELDTMTVEAEISEADVVKIKKGMRAYFTILGLPDRKFESTLRQIEPSPNSDSSTSTTSTSSSQAIYYKALFDVSNPEGILRDSMTAEVTVILGESKNVLMLPISVLRKKVGPNQYEVKVEKEPGISENRIVTVGKKDHINYEIIDGITEDDLIIVGNDLASAEAKSLENPRAGRMRPPM